MSLQWRFFPVSEFAGHAATWTRINDDGGGSALLDARFVEPLLAFFAGGRELLGVCSRDGAPVAMTIVEKTAVGRWQTFQATQSPLGAWVQVRSVGFERLLDSLLRALPGFAIALSVTRQDPDLVRRPAPAGGLDTLDAIHTARVLIEGTFEDYWKAREGKLRQETNRRLKRLQANGLAPCLETVTDPAAVADAVRDFGRLESGGWKGREGTAVHADSLQGRFYTRMLEGFCSAGRGRIYRYRLGDHVGAVQLCIQGAHEMVFLKTTYDEAMRSHGPGILMQHDIMKQLFAESAVARVEFYGRTGEAQAKWCDGRIRALYHVNRYRWPWLPAVRAGITGMRKRFAARSARSDIAAPATSSNAG